MKMEDILKEKIETNCNPSHLEIHNESHMHSSGLGSESHFRVLIVSENFRAQNKVQRQRSIYQLFTEELKSKIHALSLRLLTPEEWSTEATSDFASPPCHSKKKA